MPLLILFLLPFLLASCAGSKAGPKQSGKSLHQVLEEAFCPGADDFRGIGIGLSESEALAQARSDMALRHFSSKLKSDVQITAQNINEIASSTATINIDQKAILINPQDARLHYSERQNKEVGVVVCMSRSDFMAYCAQMMESSFGEARRNLGLSKQLMEADRKKDALEKLGESRRHVETVAEYRNALLAVDIKSDSERIQEEQISELLKEIAAMKIELESGALVFIAGSESIQNQATEIIVPRIQTMLSENNIKITEKQEEASHILSIDAKVCNPKSDEHFHYASACVKVTFANVRTGKNEIAITVNGRKEGGLDERNAGERAFKSAAAEVWTKIKDKIMEISL
jgi:hypothetical protein